MELYQGPAEDTLDEADVCAALDFLIAIEPDPTPATRAAYDAALAPFKPQLHLAMATLRKFAQQSNPLTLERLRKDFYDITRLDRYLRSPEIHALVVAALNEAWKGVAGWQR